MPYIGYTVLQLLDIQYVARTHMFHDAGCHLQSIGADYQLFVTYGGHQFFPPSVVILDLNAYMMDLSLKVEDSGHYLQYICADYQSFAIEGGCWFFPPLVVILDQTAYMLVAGFATEWHNWQVGLCNALKVNMLQNSMPYMNHTVLQSIDRQRVAETHLFHTISYHLQSICTDYQLFVT